MSKLRNSAYSNFRGCPSPDKDLGQFIWLLVKMLTPESWTSSYSHGCPYLGLHMALAPMFLRAVVGGICLREKQGPASSQYIPIHSKSMQKDPPKIKSLTTLSEQDPYMFRPSLIVEFNMVFATSLPWFLVKSEVGSVPLVQLSALTISLSTMPGVNQVVTPIVHFGFGKSSAMWKFGTSPFEVGDLSTRDGERDYIIIQKNGLSMIEPPWVLPFPAVMSRPLLHSLLLPLPGATQDFHSVQGGSFIGIEPLSYQPGRDSHEN